jgi:hypothetical protein
MLKRTDKEVQIYSDHFHRNILIKIIIGNNHTQENDSSGDGSVDEPPCCLIC